MTEIAALLSGGDRRSIGRAGEVISKLADGTADLERVWLCLRHDDPVVRMRAADVLEKHTRGQPAALMPFKGDLLARLRVDGPAEMQWHFIAMVSRLELNESEANDVCVYLDGRLRKDRSRIVRVMALQAACDIAMRVPPLHGCVAAMVAYARSSGIPSVQARARRVSHDFRTPDVQPGE